MAYDDVDLKYGADERFIVGEKLAKYVTIFRHGHSDAIVWQLMLAHIDCRALNGRTIHTVWIRYALDCQRSANQEQWSVPTKVVAQRRDAKEYWLLIDLIFDNRQACCQTDTNVN